MNIDAYLPEGPSKALIGYVCGLIGPYNVRLGYKRAQTPLRGGSLETPFIGARRSRRLKPILRWGLSGMHRSSGGDSGKISILRR